LLFRPF
jgi:hypothetical protein